MVWYTKQPYSKCEGLSLPDEGRDLLLAMNALGQIARGGLAFFEGMFCEQGALNARP